MQDTIITRMYCFSTNQTYNQAACSLPFRAGLLELGERQFLMGFLRTELQQYAEIKEQYENAVGSLK